MVKTSFVAVEYEMVMELVAIETAFVIGFALTVVVVFFVVVVGIVVVVVVVYKYINVLNISRNSLKIWFYK